MIAKGTSVMLWSREEKYMVTVDGEPVRLQGLGVVNTDRFLKMSWGEEIEIGPKVFRLLRPTLEHAPELFKRGPQIIQPHMASLIVHHCEIHCGDTVVEGGAGSGMLSAVLCRAVGGTGKVCTYEIREDHLKIAKSNLNMLQGTEVWSPSLGDVTKDVKERDVDAFVVDIPEPWGALDMVEYALKEGSYFASYVPSVNQMEKIYKEMEKRNFSDLRAFESFHRDMVVGKGTRPSFDMRGHMGYVVVGCRNR